MKKEENTSHQFANYSKIAEIQPKTNNKSFETTNKSSNFKQNGENNQVELQTDGNKTNPQSNMFSAINHQVPLIAFPLNTFLVGNLLTKANVAANMQMNNQMLQNLQVIMGQLIKNQQLLSLFNTTLGVGINYGNVV